MLTQGSFLMRARNKSQAPVVYGRIIDCHPYSASGGWADGPIFAVLMPGRFASNFRRFCKKTRISTGHLSKVLTGNATPSGAMLISIAKEGFDVNLILAGVSYSEMLSERESEIEKLKLIIDELRSIINFNLKKS